jgi:hypothetical protein
MRYHATTNGNIPYTPEEEAARDLEDAASLLKKQADDATKAIKASKIEGIEILGVMCSATKEDQNGMVAVGTSKLMSDMGGLPFADTVFEFSNGNTLVITSENFNTVYAAWVPFRQDFFTAS